jgi:hypothetical protein
MLPSQHFVFGTIFASVVFFLYPSIGWADFVIIIFSTVLIDVDHYVGYVYKKKSFSLIKSYNWFSSYLNKIYSLPKSEREKTTLGIIYFLHGIEVLVILFGLSFAYNFFIYIFVGFAFHLLLDYIDEQCYRDRIEKFSIINDFYKLKRLKTIKPRLDYGKNK